MSITSFDLNLLLVLQTVLRERSVARAAERLHVTPSAISNSLAKLRTALGDPLVTRKGRGIVPTARANELAPVLERAITELEAAVSPGPFDGARCTRVFTLAMADALQVAWLPRISASLASSMPLARLRVVGIDTLLALGDLASGEVDLHVGVRATGPGIHARDLYEECTALVARAGHSACRGSISAGALAELAHVAVVLAPGPGSRDPVAQAYAKARVERRVVLTVSTFAAAAAVAAATDLVATLPVSFLAAHGAALGLLPVRGAVPSHSAAIALCWHRRTDADPALVALRAIVAGALARPAPESKQRRGRRLGRSALGT